MEQRIAFSPSGRPLLQLLGLFRPTRLLFFQLIALLRRYRILWFILHRDHPSIELDFFYYTQKAQIKKGGGHFFYVFLKSKGETACFSPYEKQNALQEGLQREPVIPVLLLIFPPTAAFGTKQPLSTRQKSNLQPGFYQIK